MPEESASFETAENSAVEAVSLDVGCDSGVKQAGAKVSGLQAATEFGGGSFLVDRCEQVDSRSLGWCEGERRELSFAQGKLGSADHDPLGKREQAIGRAPTAQVKEAVGTGEDVERCAWQLVCESFQGIYAEIWTAVGTRGVEGGDGEAGVGRSAGYRLLVVSRGLRLCSVFQGKAGHGDAVGVGSAGRIWFQGLIADGRKQHAVERKGVCRGACQA